MSDFYAMVLDADPKAAKHLHDLTRDELAHVHLAALEAIRLVREERNRRAPSTKAGPTRSLRRDTVEPNFGSRVK